MYILNFLVNNKVTSAILFVILTVLAVVLVYNIFKIVKGIRLLITNKNGLAYEKYRNASAECLDSFELLQRTIETMVVGEVGKCIEKYAALGSRYPIKNLDDDVKAISTLVYSSLNKEVISSLRLIVNEQYIFSLICGTTTRLMLNTAMSLNNQLDTLGSVAL